MSSQCHESQEAGEHWRLACVVTLVITLSEPFYDVKKKKPVHGVICYLAKVISLAFNQIRAIKISNLSEIIEESG